MTEQDKLDRITSLLINKLNMVEISKEEIRKYVQNNIMFFIANENILNNIYLLMNNNNLYAVVYVVGNRYSWSIYKEGHLSNISDDINIIIEDVLRFIDAQKIEVINKNEETNTLEEKANKVRGLNFNTRGYHIR
jgi:hypothetical protein